MVEELRGCCHKAYLEVHYHREYHWSDKKDRSLYRDLSKIVGGDIIHVVCLLSEKHRSLRLECHDGTHHVAHGEVHHYEEETCNQAARLGVIILIAEQGQTEKSDEYHLPNFDRALHGVSLNSTRIPPH